MKQEWQGDCTEVESMSNKIRENQERQASHKTEKILIDIREELQKLNAQLEKADRDRQEIKRSLEIIAISST